MIAFTPFGAWSLKTKFALCSGVLMVAFSGAFTTWTMKTVRADLISSVTDAQKALVRSTADGIDEKIDLRRAALTKTAVALSATARAPVQAAAMDAFFESQPVIRDMFDGMAIVDASGRFVYDTERAEGRVGSSVADRAYFKRLLAGSPAETSSPLRTRNGDKPMVVVFAAPLHTPAGEFSGALLASLVLTRPNFLGRLGDARIGRDGGFILIEKSDPPVFVMHNDKSRILAPVDLFNEPQLSQALKGFEGTLQTGDPIGTQALRSAASLRSVPWVLVAEYPTAEAFAGLRAREQEILWLAGALCLLASCIVWLMAGWLLRPLKRLQALMAPHAIDLATPMPPASFGSAELAGLVAAYNAQALGRLEFEDRLKASERRMREITDAIPAKIAHIDFDGRYTFANVGTERAFGVAPGALVGLHMNEVGSDQMYAEIAPHVGTVLGGEPVSFECTGLIDGEVHHYHASYLPDRDEGGQLRGFYSMLFDVTALKHARDRQASIEQRLRAIADHMPALIAHIDTDERYDFLNATFKKWVGIDPVTSIGRRMAEVMGPVVYARRHELVARCLAGETLSFEWEENLLVGRKTLRIEYLPDIAPDGSVVGFYTFSSDVTELKDAQLSLSRLVRSDSLTGLPNRYQFNELLPQALARCARSRQGLALMFIDIDHFKQINDSFGHATGDTVLKEFAARLQHSVRKTDLAARLGGDEFVVVLEGLHSDAEPQLVARKILAEISKPFNIEGRLLAVTTSIGIAYQAAEGASAKALLAVADTALYEAKAAGRNTYRMSLT